MYLPFATLCQQHDVHAIYWREMVNDGTNDWLINDAFRSPFDELSFPKLACHYPLDDSVVATPGTTREIVNGQIGTYDQASPNFSAGPTSSISSVYGRNGGINNRDVLTSTTSKITTMMGPVPSSGYVNPVGIDGSFSLACWFRINDLDTSFNPSGDTGGRTNITLVGVQNYDSTYTAKGFTARLILQRRCESGAVPGFWLRGEMSGADSIPDAGSASASIETDPAATPYDAAMQNETWHYAALTVSVSSTPGAGTMALWIDGTKVQQRTYSGVTFPATPRFRIGINTTIGASTDYSMRDGQIAYVSAYKSPLTQIDQRRHYNSMRRPLDMKVNHNSFNNMYSTEPMTSVGSFTETDLTHCPTAQRAEHRHDGRWVNMIRLNSPLYDSQNEAIDDELEQYNGALPRHWQLKPDAASPSTWTADDRDQDHRFNLMLATGGYRVSISGAAEVGTGPTIIAGFDGVNAPRGSAYPTDSSTPDDQNAGRDHTVIWDMKGNGENTPRMTWTFSTGASASLEDNDLVEGIDGPDGFALSRTGAINDTSVNKFDFYCPWETTTEDRDQTVSTSNSAGKSNTYQAIGAAAGRTGMTVQVVNPNGHTSDNYREDRTPSQYVGFVSDPEDTVYRVNRHGEPALPRFLYCNRNSNSSGLDVPAQGNDFCVDQNRYGPIAVFGEALEPHQVTRILRVMHGQPLMRTRPGLRSPLRHFHLTAPTRSMT